MPSNLQKTFARKYKYLCISVSAVLLLSACQISDLNYYYFHSKHLKEEHKAPFLHELVHALELDSQSQLQYRLYGNWGYSLTPLDLDNKLNGECTNTRFSGGKPRARRDVSSYKFFSDVFQPNIYIMSRGQNDCGYEPYLEYFEEQPNLNEAVHLALLRFQEIAERLEILYFNKLDLVEKYDDIEHLIKPIDEDIISLSKAGFRLAQSTKTFFALAKEQLALQDIVDVRNKGMSDLKTFSLSLEQVKQSQYDTLEDATMATIKALEGLKQDINK